MAACLTHRVAWIASKLGSYKGSGAIEHAACPGRVM